MRRLGLLDQKYRLRCPLTKGARRPTLHGMNEQYLFDFIDAVSDANTIILDYENGESDKQSAIDAWQNVICALDKMDDNQYNIQCRVNAISVIQLLREVD